MTPPFRPPVQRPELINAFQAVDLGGGSAGAIFGRLVGLVHGANYNDPPKFAPRDYRQLRRTS